MVIASDQKVGGELPMSKQCATCAREVAEDAKSCPGCGGLLPVMDAPLADRARLYAWRHPIRAALLSLIASLALLLRFHPKSR